MSIGANRPKQLFAWGIVVAGALLFTPGLGIVVLELVPYWVPAATGLEAAGGGAETLPWLSVVTTAEAARPVPNDRDPRLYSAALRNGQSATSMRGRSNKSVVRAYQPRPCIRPIRSSFGVSI